jgi:hypothetical protein
MTGSYRENLRTVEMQRSHDGIGRSWGAGRWYDEETDDLLGTPRLQDGHYLPPQARRPL